MPDDNTEGLIERAAALLRQPRSHRLEGGSGADSFGSQKAGRHPNHPAGIGLPAPPVPIEADLQPMPAPSIEHEEWSLRRLLRALSLHKFVMIATGLLIFVISAVAIFSLTPRYTAVAVVAVGNRAPSIATRIQSDVEGAVVQLSPDAAAVRTQVDYLRSRPVAEAAMDQLNLWKLPEFGPSVQRSGSLAWMRAWIGDAIVRFYGLVSGHSSPGNRDTMAADRAAANRNAAVDLFLSKLSVDAEPNSQIITVRFEDPSPKLAAAAANAIADAYIARQIDMASASAEKATKGLEQAVAALRQRVAQSDQAYEQYRGVFEARDGHDLLTKENEQATQELTQAEIARGVLEARLAAIRSVAGKSDAATNEITASPVMHSLHEQAAKLETQLGELSTTLGDANPNIQGLRAAIARAHGQMRAEVARQTAALEAELKVAEAKEASLRQRLAASRAGSARASPGQAKLGALKVEATANHAVLEAFLTRLHEANTTAGLVQHANAEIVARASAPRSPTFPNTKLLLFVAAVASTVAGVAAAIAREKAAPTFRSSEEIERETGIRTLALVPLIDKPDGPPETALGSPTSLYGEAIRTLYMTLLLRQRLKTFVVTSARAGDGKTTLAASLALIGAKAGRKVLLVDADLCTAGATRLFRLKGHDGIAELITGKRRFAEVVAIGGTTGGTDPNFHFLAAGTSGNLLAARAGLEEVRGLLRGLREEYDLIVVDSPPVLAVSDAMVLSAQADATLFAVRWASTPRAAVKLGLKCLHSSADGSSVGIVLTMVDARHHSRFGYADSAFYTKDLVAYSHPGKGDV
jgi:capsular exopolysaccharide synthesis family protein